MFNPDEEIQILGIDLGVNSTDWQTNYILETEITKLNKKLELKNRYKESLEKETMYEDTSVWAYYKSRNENNISHDNSFRTFNLSEYTARKYMH